MMLGGLTEVHGYCFYAPDSNHPWYKSEVSKIDFRSMEDYKLKV